MVSGIYEGLQARIAEFAVVDEPKLPAIRLLDFSSPAGKKYELMNFNVRDNLTVETLKTFLADFSSGTLLPQMRSLPIPSPSDKPLKTIVGYTFKSLVLDSPFEVLVKFYAPWCGHCKSMAADWEALAAEVLPVQGLIVAEFDATKNEAEGILIQSFP